MKTIDLLTNQPPSARHGFTLIELLVVITIIGVLAEFTLVVVGGVEKTKYISTARAEMGAIQTALESYKAAYGFYPPSNPTPLPDHQLFNPLYFELEGVTNSNTSYGTLDGSQMVSSNTLFNLCGVSGVVNCTHGSGEDIVRAKNFLTDLRANQVGGLKTGAGPMVVLVTTVGGPDTSCQPLGVPILNPWRYNSANPTNNPGTYDLYVQLKIGGKTNLVCNWSKQVAVNNPLP
jgi:prepilin-type N-terminal cleavage/methylation domain-containing protein